MNRKQRRLADKQGRAAAPGSAALPAVLRTAVQHHQAGRLAEAERLYRQILAVDPRHAGSLHLLGLLALTAGRPEAAVELIGQAIAIREDAPFPHNDLGNAWTALGRLDDAVASYRRALVLKPDYADAHHNLGVALHALGQFDAAVASYGRAGALKPDVAAIHSNLGNALHTLGRLDAAVASYERALALTPDAPELHNNLANVHKDRGRFEDAVRGYERALTLRPDYAKAHNNLGSALKDQGRAEAAVAHFERALALAPELTEAHSNLLLSLHYISGLAADWIPAETRRWDELHARSHRPAAPPEERQRDPARRLRVGYVSPDFRRHSVSTFVEPLWRAHDRSAVELFGYAEVRAPDEVTGRLRDLADHWVVTTSLSDAALAQRIGADRIDILVDLAGHTANNRLLVFARKPAPVQVAWLGYPDVTGLSTMDFRFVDAVTDPDAGDDAGAPERLVRLPQGFLCYAPPDDAPAPLPPPSVATGAITFGSFNNPAKLSPATLDAWAALLLLRPGAQILLKGHAFADAAARARIHAQFAGHGVVPERVVLAGPLPQAADHLAAYRRVDIALDPFPYNGTTTTCEALWMGVPVVTLCGDTHAARVGASLLGRLGLDDLIARDVDGYIEIAAALAGDQARLVDLRQTLRARLSASPLCDAPAFARQIEAAYRDFWRRWCETDARSGQSV